MIDRKDGCEWRLPDGSTAPLLWENCQRVLDLATGLVVAAFDRVPGEFLVLVDVPKRTKRVLNILCAAPDDDRWRKCIGYFVNGFEYTSPPGDDQVTKVGDLITWVVKKSPYVRFSQAYLTTTSIRYYIDPDYTKLALDQPGPAELLRSG